MPIPSMGDHFLMYLAVAVAAALGGMSRGFSGFGAAMVFMPVASAVLTPVVATPVLLLTDLISSSLLLRGALAKFSWREVKWIMLGALLGFPLGLEILTRSDPISVRWAASAIILASLIFIASGWRYRGHRTMPLTVGVGVISGAMSGIAQIGNPPILAYWLGVDMPPERMRANLIVYFTVLTMTGVAVFAMKGLMTIEVLGLVAAALPAYAFGMWSGNRVFPLASKSTFRGIALALIVTSIITGLPVLDHWLHRK
jgi:uncharacterized protein